MRFQFGLRQWFAATSLASFAACLYLAATRVEPPTSIMLFVVACTFGGSAVGMLFRQAVIMALVGWLVGFGLVWYAISHSEL